MESKVMSKMESVIAYADKGWKLFPLSPNTKIPLAGTHGVKDATDDKHTLIRWWTENPEANIGLACGSASGVWVVDVDVRVDTDVNGFRSIEEAGKKLSPTWWQSTPSGGAHYLYKCTGARPANKNGFLRGVDIRGDGYYIVVSPSVVNGKKYSWERGTAEMAEYPEDFKPSRADSVFDFVSPPPARDPAGSSSSDRARAYLAEIPGAVEHVDGHSKLFWVAQVLVNGFRLSDSEAEEMMWKEYNPRCVPPWTRNAKTEKEFRHKIEEAHRKPNREAVAIYDADSRQVSDFSLEACLKGVEGLLSVEKKAPASRPPSKEEARLNDLMRPDGLVGDIAQWINSTAGCYQPWFALGAALTLCGAVFGRKVRDESNGRTNIYCMGVGHSSSGKDYPGECIQRILAEAGAQDMLMGRPTSDTAIEKALYEHPVKISVMDEVGHFFSNINKAGEGAMYLKTIKPTLMELFSSSHKVYVGKQKAEQGAKLYVIDQPCLSIWGVTAPQKLYNGMTMEELQDGWIARNLIFISETRPKYVIKPTADPPSDIVSAIKAWLSRVPDGADMILSSSPGMTYTPMTIAMNQEARDEFNKFADMAYENMIEAGRRKDKTEYLWGKALQNARRIALIVACGKEYSHPTIGQYEAKYGCDLINYLIMMAAKAIENNVSENQWESAKLRLVKIVSESGNRGITKRDLTRKSQWIKNKTERNQYIEELVDCGRIFLDKNAFGTMVYMSAEAHRDLEAAKEVEHEDDDE